MEILAVGAGTFVLILVICFALGVETMLAIIIAIVCAIASMIMCR